MERLLITQTLLSSWGYMYSCHDSAADQAYEEFLSTLNREKKPTTEAMQNGIDFENEVYKEAAGAERKPHPKWENGIKAVAGVIKGAPVQVKVSRELDIGKHRLLVYGILDALKAGTIYDVKFTNKSFNTAELAGKYLNSAQHPAYLYMVPEALEFTYLVSDGEDLYPETYMRKDSRPIEEIVKEFLDDLERYDLMRTYTEKWIAK